MRSARKVQTAYLLYPRYYEKRSGLSFGREYASSIKKRRIGEPIRRLGTYIQFFAFIVTVNVASAVDSSEEGTATAFTSSQEQSSVFASLKIFFTVASL